MSCVVPYLNNLDISPKEKTRLTKLHNEIYDEVKKSMYFRERKGSLVLHKHGFTYASAAKVLKNINNRLGSSVLSILYDSKDGYFKAMIDTSKLKKQEDDIIMQPGNQYFFQGEIYPTYDDALNAKEEIIKNNIDNKINDLFESGDLQIDCTL